MDRLDHRHAFNNGKTGFEIKVRGSCSVGTAPAATVDPGAAIGNAKSAASGDAAAEKWSSTAGVGLHRMNPFTRMM